MENIFEYPFNSEFILKKSKSIKKDLLENSENLIEKRIAILGGSTTSDIKKILELFLLHHGIKPSFYESEYGKFYEDSIFDNKELDEFHPEIIYIHTSNRNIINFPRLLDSAEKINSLLDNEFAKFNQIWQNLKSKYNCIIIQNNFEPYHFRLLGNKDASSIHGRNNFIVRLNLKFYEYSQVNSNFFINDINYLAADYGLSNWLDQFYWHMYKYSLSFQAIPYLCSNISNIIKSIYGKNKKSLVLDLDNTLWGGIVGDDGAENISIGQETSIGQVYSEFQEYIKLHKDLGVILNVASKNEEENAIAGLSRPDSVLTPSDFISIKANWAPKSENISQLSQELTLLPESFVFVDDNPAEREIVSKQLPKIAVPTLNQPENYILAIDRNGYFETTNFSKDDATRSEMYKENAQRATMQATFANYEDYLLSLEMAADVKPFEPLYMSRISQLTNKSNQFNLTTKRYSQADIESFASNVNYITLYGKLVDKFGDNGVVTVVIGKKENKKLHLDLWLMSCRVLKRDLELALLDKIAEEATNSGINELIGYYYPTAKNNMVKNFYEELGFTKIQEDEQGNSTWSLKLDSYSKKCKVIKVN